VTLKNTYKKPIGFQDHTAGDAELASYLPFVALGAGVNVIEKHLTLTRAAKIEDYISALTPEEFAQWSSYIKAAYKSLGISEWVLTEKELHYRSKVRRAVCTVKDIPKDSMIKIDDITLRRTDKKDVLCDIDAVVGRKTIRVLSKNSAIAEGDLV
jgi:sialic acid synthase SpsE